jgi:hypothetical protein
MYLETYQGVMADVGKYCKAHGINLVMRFNGDPYDASDPEGLKKELNKAVLYQDGIDITDDILAIVNSRHSPQDLAAGKSGAKREETQRK